MSALGESFDAVHSLEVADKCVSGDGSVMYLWELSDGERVESIFFWRLPQNTLPAPAANILPAAGEPVVCISSQTGCNVGCRFCATGLQPAKRNLTPAEIVGQVASVTADQGLSPMRVHFAGMGEPMLAYEPVVAAAGELLESGLAASVTIVTTGIPHLVRRLADEPVDVGLYVSLHATTDDRRTQLVPTNKKYPMAEVLEAAREFARKRGTMVRIGYLLLPGYNDSERDAERLARLLDPDIFHVQLLMWNAVPGLPFTRISDEEAVAFCARLHELGLTAHVSRSVGRDVQAGCGQMATKPPSERRLATIRSVVR